MERNFYQDNFEQLLKESADNFRMYPSRRVWHSIYNDLHPSRKWPSLAIWLLFISSAIYLGMTNRNYLPANKQAGNKTPTGQLLASAQIPARTAGYNNNSLSQNNNQDKLSFKPVVQGASQVKLATAGLLHSFSSETNVIDTRNNPLNNRSNVLDEQSASIISYYNDKTAGTNTVSQSEVAINDVAAGKQLIAGNKKQKETIGIEAGEIAANASVADQKKEKQLTKEEAEKIDLLNAISEKEWKEDFAFHNKPFISKWRSRVSYQLYITPSIGYRIISSNSSFNGTPMASSLIVNNPNSSATKYRDAVSQHAAVNMELGGNFLYSLNKAFNLKVGVQFNYTNYRINAYELKHPTTTTLLLNDLNSGSTTLSPRPTSLANSEGVYSTKLNNNTYQISLPIGADFKLAGNSNFKWFAGATIQPTYVINGDAYFISSDLKNYVTDKSLMRRWNLNAGIETFVSYKTKSGITLNAGPQFRYQLMSTYSQEYTYKEKLYNLGLKIGIITRF